MKKVTIYTDGACLGNPGAGGWATTLEHGGVKKEFSGGELATTNNRMELQAAIEALRKLKEPCEIDLFTDSEYLREGITTWINAWKARGWKKKIKNKDLWQELDSAVTLHQIRWHWVRGHSGNPGNERVDVLSMGAARKIEARTTPEQRQEAVGKFLKARAAIPEQPELLKDDRLL